MAAGDDPWFRDLYDRLLGYGGPDCHGEVLRPWLPRARRAVSHLGRFRGFFLPADGDDTFEPDLWKLYALCRVNDFLLLPFQGDRDGPQVTAGQYAGFFGAIGLTPFAGGAFSAFRHEVAGVVEADDPGDPPVVLETLWPGLMLGGLLVSRAGVRVRAGRGHLDPAVAVTSTLYFAHRRLARRTEDLSAGWGSNSQWRTRFRRDYKHDGWLLYNVDGDVDLAADTQFGGERDELDGLPVRSRIELCKHRCLVVSGATDAELWPYSDRYRERADGPTAVGPGRPAWAGGVAGELAAAVAADGAFDRLPVLADALEERGCRDGTLLGHLRGPGPHGPRCWAVEYLLSWAGAGS